MTPPEPVTLIAPKAADVGGLPVQRLLPRAGRRTIGAWCFVDIAGPVDVGAASMQVGPHPHIGLHTVTWMIAGEVMHRDSLGGEQMLRPGELNLMTAGHGIAHAEQVPVEAKGALHLVQLWVAQPDTTRHGPPDFAHHADLPRVTVNGTQVTALLGEVLDARSPVRCDTPLMGAEVRLTGALTLPVDPSFEHGVLPLDGDVIANNVHIASGHLGYLPPGARTLQLSSSATTRLLVLGGEPFTESLRMHWNFVARTTDELAEAVSQWNAGDPGRFGAVGGGLPRTPAPPLPGR
jgi:quercetin 2,3-dioxygenase